jgi:DNA-binding CsgD family transcriptional regulator
VTNRRVKNAKRLTLDVLTGYPLNLSIGFGILGVWGALLFYNAGLTFPSIPTELLAHAHIGSSLSFTIGALGLAIAFRRISPLSTRRELIIGCGSVGALAVAAAFLASNELLDIFWLYIAISGCGFILAVLIIAYAEMFASYGTKGTIVMLVTSTVINYLLYLIVSNLSTSLMQIIAALLPIVSSYLLKGKDIKPQSEDTSLSFKSLLRNLPLRLCFAGTLLFCTYGVLRSVSMFSKPDSDDVLNFLMMLLVFVLPNLVATFIAMLFSGKNINKCFPVIIALSVLSALVISIPTLSFDYSIAISGLGSETLSYLIWFIIVDMVQAEKVNALLAVSFLQVCKELGILLGQLIGEFIVVTPSSAVTIILVILVAAALIGIGNTSMVITVIEPRSDVVGISKINISALSERFSLTSREQEVLELWSLGHSSGFIEQKLSISHNTAKTHIANIYRKVGVRSRDQLKALVDSNPSA